MRNPKKRFVEQHPCFLIEIGEVCNFDGSVRFMSLVSITHKICFILSCYLKSIDLDAFEKALLGWLGLKKLDCDWNSCLALALLAPLVPLVLALL